MTKKTKLSFTVLGCGTSTGVPLIGCTCKTCRSKNPKNDRLRAAAWVQTQGKSILIDTSTDLRQQALRARITRVDAVLYTHPHADHIHGIDELRSFNFLQKEQIPLYGNDWTEGDLNERFPYIFNPTPVEGGGIPRLRFHKVDSKDQNLNLGDVPITPISLQHGAKECLGYRFDSIAYITDCSYIPPASMDRLRGLSVLFLDCVRLAPHPTHFNLDQALETISVLKPGKTFLTHLGHEFDFTVWSKKLPKGVFLSYDGLKVTL